MTNSGLFIVLFVAAAAQFLFAKVQGHPKCNKGRHVRHFDVYNEKKPSVFDDLTLKELDNVARFLKRQPELALKELDEATLNSTYIYNIETLSPSKASVLHYLDNKGSKPQRYAWVILIRGDVNPPVVEDYKVGPLPHIKHYHKIDMLGQNRDLEHYRHSISGFALVIAMEEVIARELKKVDDLLADITGYSYNDCGDRCLSYETGHPGRFKSGTRTLYITLLRDLEGSYLHPIGLEFRIDTKTEMNVDDWIVDYVWFRGETFSSFNDMRDNLERPNNSNFPVFEDNKDLFSSLNQRGDPVPEGIQRGPRSFMPDGRRYSVDGHHISWMNWEFDFNLRSIMGLQVHDVRFKQERIAYELALSEIAVIYMSGTPTTIHSAFLDSTWDLGEGAMRMFTELECPEHAEYFDFAHYINFKPTLVTHSACLFEMRKSVPLRRHLQDNYKGGYYYTQGVPGNVLVLRSTITVAYYEYIFDYVFNQNGVLEMSIALSGYIMSSWTADGTRVTPFGYEVYPNVLGPIHHHLIHLKADLDILSTKNRFATLDLKTERIQSPVDANDTLVVQKFEKNLRETELNATYQYNFNTPKYLIMSNNAVKNGVGNERGYRLLLSGMSKQILPEDWQGSKAFSWAKYQVAVSKQKDTEARATTVHEHANYEDTLLDFDSFINDDEAIVDEDLVAWVTLGSFHIPHSDDIPIVQTPGMAMTLYLMPFNFFDEDPSIQSRDNMRFTPANEENDDVIYEGESMAVDCEPRLTTSPNL